MCPICAHCPQYGHTLLQSCQHTGAITQSTRQAVRIDSRNISITFLLSTAFLKAYFCFIRQIVYQYFLNKNIIQKHLKDRFPHSAALSFSCKQMFFSITNYFLLLLFRHFSKCGEVIVHETQDFLQMFHSKSLPRM